MFIKKPCFSNSFCATFLKILDYNRKCFFSSLCQASCLYCHGEDQTGATGQLYVVWKEKKAVQRQIFGKAQCRYEQKNAGVCKQVTFFAV